MATRPATDQRTARFLVPTPEPRIEPAATWVVDKGIPKKEGALDAVKFTETINAEARRFGGAIGAGPRVTGMGVAPAVVEITEGQRASAAATQKAEKVQFLEAYATLLGEQPDANGNLKLAEAAFRGRAS